MLLFSFLLLMLVENIRGQFKASCPAIEAIRPCTCAIDSTSRLPWVTCSGLTSLDRFEKSMKFLKWYSLSSLYIEKSNLGNIPSDIFDGTEIRSLKISFTNLTKLGESRNRPPFIGLENSVEDIEIKESFVDEQVPMKSFSLAHLKKLTLFESTNNIVPNIPNDWFESGPYGIKQILFQGSSTKKLGSHAFSSLVNAREISVTGGTISEVTRSMFPRPANHLTVIDLSDNALSTLPADIFLHMPSLSEVYFDNNAFTTINEVVWSTIWNQITHVYFFGNPMNCDEGIKWIYKYRLPEVLGGSCAKPDALTKKELQKLTLKDFQ